jgi:hypothetical protein
MTELICARTHTIRLYAHRADDRDGHHRHSGHAGHSQLCGAIKHAREAVLKEDLQTMRTAIDSYTMDKQKAPQSLDDLSRKAT